MARKRKIGSSWYAMRKVGGRRRRVKVTKKGKGKYRVRIANRR